MSEFYDTVRGMIDNADPNSYREILHILVNEIENISIQTGVSKRPINNETPIVAPPVDDSWRAASPVSVISGPLRPTIGTTQEVAVPQPTIAVPQFQVPAGMTALPGGPDIRPTLVNTEVAAEIPPAVSAPVGADAPVITPPAVP